MKRTIAIAAAAVLSAACRKEVPETEAAGRPLAPPASEARAASPAVAGAFPQPNRSVGVGHLIVVTVDPEHDTPAVLKEYAEKAGADPARWSFLTGEPVAVADVASRFGILYSKKGSQILHQQGVAVVDPEGRLATIYYGDTWQPEHVLRDMEKARKG